MASHNYYPILDPIKSQDQITFIHLSKECKDSISPMLTIIFNKYFASGKVPLDWKQFFF